MVSALPDNSAGSPVGVALSLTELVARDSRLAKAGVGEWRVPLEAPAADSATWPSLANALRSLGTLLNESRRSLSIALLPTVSEVRRLDVPPLPDDELEMILARNAAKYFVAARGPQIASVAESRAPRSKNGAVAATVPAWIVRLITAAATEAGWTVRQLVPAEAAWARAAVAIWPASARGDASVLVHHRDRTDVLQLHNGAVSNVRRFRSAVSEVPVMLEALSPAPALFSMGSAPERKEWLALLAQRSITVALPTNIPNDVANDSATVAAAFADDASTMLFRTDAMRQADRRRRSRVMWSLGAASAVMLATAAGFSYWDVKRELASVEAARAAIQPQLAVTMVGRTSVETVSGQLQMLSVTESGNPHWARIIAELTEHLPADAYLTRFQGHGDSVTFEGMATRASQVFPAMERVPSFEGVKAAAAVRREAGDEGEALEKFTLAAKLRGVQAVNAKGELIVPKPARTTTGSATSSGRTTVGPGKANGGAS